MIRNLGELGPSLIKIVKRLQANQELLKYLYYTDKDPLSKEDLTKEQIQKEIFEKLIKVVPRVGPKDNAKSLIALRVTRGRPNFNDEFTDISINIEIFTPLTQWFIKEENFRPFAIMGEIQRSLKGKKIDGIGKIEGGEFDLNFLTDEISCYEMVFYITNYD